MIFPTHITHLLRTYSSYILSPPLLYDLDIDPGKKTTKMILNLEFINHPVYGRTQLRIRETYNSESQLILYRYNWERNNKPESSITAWENEHYHNVSTDPHHHHHVPFDRKQAKENSDVRCLADALTIIIPYIQTGNEYP